MSYTIRSPSQQSFADAVTRVLRESRRRQKSTQAELADRTGGLVSKAALANYEAGQRSLRIDVVWVLAGALGEDLGALMTTAQLSVLPESNPLTAAVTVDVTDLLSRNDPRLAPVHHWFQMHDAPVTLDHQAIAAMARLLGVSEQECRRIVCPHGGPESGRVTGRPSSQEPDGHLPRNQTG